MNWKGVLSGVAPAIAGALGGPAAGLATRALAGALLGKPDASEESISAAIAGATPDDLLKLKQADQQFAKDMEAYEVEREKIAAGDRANAREREIATKDWVVKALALIVMGLFTAVVVLMWRAPVPEGNRDAANQVLGILYGAVMLVLGYYFGSSVGSRNKDNLFGGK